VLADAESGEILARENASERLSMGSTDKIMVALVALSSRASEALLREGPWVRDGALAVLRLAIIRRRIRCPHSWGEVGKGKGGVGHRTLAPSFNPRPSRRSRSWEPVVARNGQN
jgi:hypothetical protein